MSKEAQSDYSMKSAAEVVLDKLTELLSRLNKQDKAYGDLQYCITMIASGKMLDGAEWSEDDDSESDNEASNSQADQDRKLSSKDNIKSWYKQYSQRPR
mgnify:CR=1 FL=1